MCSSDLTSFWTAAKTGLGRYCLLRIIQLHHINFNLGKQHIDHQNYVFTLTHININDRQRQIAQRQKICIFINIRIRPTFPPQTFTGSITDQAIKACDLLAAIRRRPVERHDWSRTVHEYRFADDGTGLMASALFFRDYSLAELEAARPHIIGIKLYPAGMTTNSEAGLADPVLAEPSKIGRASCRERV